MTPDQPSPLQRRIDTTVRTQEQITAARKAIIKALPSGRNGKPGKSMSLAEIKAALGASDDDKSVAADIKTLLRQGDIIVDSSAGKGPATRYCKPAKAKAA